MNNQNKYIRLEYTADGYLITIFGEKQTFHLNQKEAEIMFPILKKFNGQQIDKDIFIYKNPMPIVIKFYQERKKVQQAQKEALKEVKKKILKEAKKVNRTKSKAIVTGTISLAAIAAVSGLLYFNHINNNDNKSNNKETVIQIEPTEIVTTPNSSQLTNQNNNEENTQINNSTNNNYIENFHYYYVKIDDKQALENAKRYDEIFSKYEKKYGVDKDLLCAIAARESSGRQDITNNGKSYGLMAIENIWTDQTIKVYNFETQNYETITVDYEKVKNDADYNVMIGSAIMQWHFNATINSGLIDETEALAYSIQRYNMGAKTMQDILKTGTHWMEGRKEETKGDKEYFEKVLTNINNGEIIEMRLIDGTYRSYNITNDALELESAHTRG